MQMRLGFGVAAFLEPDVLLVDEVLAVGDASFQQRCLDRMRDVLSQGTTLVLVSHDLAALEATCSRGVWLNQGQVVVEGAIRDVLSSYRASVEAEAQFSRRDGRVRLVSAEMSAPADGGVIRSHQPLDIDLALECESDCAAWVYVGISEGTASPIFLVNPGRETRLGPWQTSIRCEIGTLPLPRGRYYLWVGAYEGEDDGPELFPWQPISHFDVHGPELDCAPTAVLRQVPLSVPTQWSIEQG
jgi:hypothetical protein